MRRRYLRIGVLLSALLLGLAPAASTTALGDDLDTEVTASGGGSVDTNTSGTSVDTSTSFSTSSYTPDNNILPAGWSSWYAADDCVPVHSCPQLEDVAYAHLDISGAMANYDTVAEFTVIDALAGYTTLWFVCSYDGDGDVLKCFYDEERDWGMMGELSSDARALRLFPVQSAPTEYYLDLYVD